MDDTQQESRVDLTPLLINKKSNESIEIYKSLINHFNFLWESSETITEKAIQQRH